jgi:hypothetical protein
VREVIAMTRVLRIISTAAIAVLGAAVPSASPSAGDGRGGHDDRKEGRYEVWAIDQSNSPGKSFGGTLYIWKGQDIQSHPETAQREVIDLSGAVSDLCFARTGANPVRPHMLAINASQSHAIISFVASGHVVFLDAGLRTPVACIRTSVGFGGARQVHFAIPSPDETYVAAANQNGKLFERIDTDYETETFILNTSAQIDLAHCTTANGIPCEAPGIRNDNAPICPIIDSTSRFSFVTLRGGGLFVVDSQKTPMEIVAEYDLNTVHPNGCLGAEAAGKMYVDSGGGTATNVFEADLYAFPLSGYSPNNPPNTPAPRVVFSEDVEDADSHGATLVKRGRFLWIADRGRNFLWVVDTNSDQIENRIGLVGEVSDDPTPDLLVTSPSQNRVFASLRGPNPLTADPHVSTGTTPGVGVIKVNESGRDGRLIGVAPVSNLDAAGIERADVHAISLRIPPHKDHHGRGASRR